MKEEALKLADRDCEALTWEYCETDAWIREACAMIRRLVEELEEKNYRILELTKKYKALTWNDKQTKPLSDDEIKEVWFALEKEIGTCIHYGFKFARAIEERHGIK